MPAESPRKAIGIPSLLHDVPITKSTQRMCGMCFSLLLLTLLCCPLGLSRVHRLPGDRLGSGYRKINWELPMSLQFPRCGCMSHGRASGVWSLCSHREDSTKSRTPLSCWTTKARLRIQISKIWRLKTHRWSHATGIRLRVVTQRTAIRFIRIKYPRRNTGSRDQPTLTPGNKGPCSLIA